MLDILVLSVYYSLQQSSATVFVLLYGVSMHIIIVHYFVYGEKNVYESWLFEIRSTMVCRKFF